MFRLCIKTRPVARQDSSPDIAHIVSGKCLVRDLDIVVVVVVVVGVGGWGGVSVFIPNRN